MRTPFTKDAPLSMSPKVLMTDLWSHSRIDPKEWPKLMWAQEWANECMENGAYPERASDRTLVTLSHQMPPTFAAAMLRQRLVRGIATRNWLVAKGREVS